MDLKFAVLAEYASVSQDGKINILGIFHELLAPDLPFSLPQLYLVLSFEAEPAEYGQQQLVRVVLLDANHSNAEVFRLEGPAPVPWPNREGGRVYVNQLIGLGGVILQQPGEYRFLVTIEGNEKGAVPLSVDMVGTEPQEGPSD